MSDEWLSELDYAELAGLGRRLLARIIDLIVVGTVLVVVALVTPSGDRARVVVAIGLTVFFAAYEVVGTWRYGATPGKRALGIAIVTTDEGRVGSAGAGRRSFR